MGNYIEIFMILYIVKYYDFKECYIFITYSFKAKINCVVKIESFLFAVISISHVFALVVFPFLTHLLKKLDSTSSVTVSLIVHLNKQVQPTWLFHSNWKQFQK